LSQNDDFGRDFIKGFKDRLEAKASIIVREVTYEVTDATVDSQIIDLAGTKANVFLKVSTSLPRVSSSATWSSLITDFQSRGARPDQVTRTPISCISSRRRRMTSRLKPIRN